MSPLTPSTTNFQVILLLYPYHPFMSVFNVASRKRSNQFAYGAPETQIHRPWRLVYYCASPKTEVQRSEVRWPRWPSNRTLSPNPPVLKLLIEKFIYLPTKTRVWQRHCFNPFILRNSVSSLKIPISSWRLAFGHTFIGHYRGLLFAMLRYLAGSGLWHVLWHQTLSHPEPQCGQHGAASTWQFERRLASLITPQTVRTRHQE